MLPISDTFFKQFAKGLQKVAKMTKFCPILSAFMQSAIMLNVVTLNVTNNHIVLSVVVLNVTNNHFMMCVIMLSVIMPNVVFLSVVKPVCHRQDTLAWPKICKQAKETRRRTYNSPI
jgi:hypothetical protein